MKADADFFDRLRERLRRGEAIEMANVSTLDMLRQMAADTHNRRRMESQVDAQLKCRYGDDYKPPEEDADDMQVFMNSIITDSKTIKHVADAESGKKKSKVPWWAAAIGAGGLAAGLTAYLMQGEDTNTQNTLRPANPSQIISGT